MDKNKIILGSGDLYLCAYDKNTGIPADDVIEVEANSMGRIKGGATLSYTPTVYEVSDDKHYVVRRFVQSEEVSFKSGVLTWDLDNLEKLAGACEVSTDEDTGVKTMKVGGFGTSGLTPYVIHFVHKDLDYTLRITLVGTTDNGFELAFNPEEETVIDAEFKAVSTTDDNVMLIMTETPIEP